VTEAELWSVDRRGPNDEIAIATFGRPPRNLMTFEGMSELERIADAVAADESVNVLVLTGGVPGYFVGHADIADLTRLTSREQSDGVDIAVWPRTFAKLRSMPQPVIAAINGQAWGGGCEVALAATMRVAAESAHLAQVEVLLGLIPGAGGTQWLPRLVGLGRASEIIMSGRVVGAAEALAINLVEAVFPDDGFLDAVVEWSLPIAAQPRHAVVAAKQSILGAVELPLEEGLLRESRLFMKCQRQPDTLAREHAMLDRYSEAAPGDQVSFSDLSPNA
jgi:enoyl-CoA hydratase/carnithine racemase